MELGLMWNIAETFNGLMAIPNLIAVFLLSGVVVRLVASFSGTGVLPAILVMITVWEIPGSVYSIFSAEAAPQNALTPGQ